ncbi:MAG: hypothetical protein HUU43_15465 [Ignavibacteriaceae bacterium]|nr:hypothetical protein [Ignavibacteriaceae bacterium]
MYKTKKAVTNCHGLKDAERGGFSPRDAFGRIPGELKSRFIGTTTPNHSELVCHLSC